jgi:hypothetical protein
VQVRRWRRERHDAAIPCFKREIVSEKKAARNEIKIKETPMSRKNRRQVSKSAAFLAPQRQTEFNPDYTHIKRDLSRIGILAVSFFVILIALSFFLR